MLPRSLVMRRSGVQVPEAAPPKSVASQWVCAFVRPDCSARFRWNVALLALAYALKIPRSALRRASIALVRLSSSAAGASSAYVCQARAGPPGVPASRNCPFGCRELVDAAVDVVDRWAGSRNIRVLARVTQRTRGA